MPESDLHLSLKRVACRWLWRAGYAAIAEEVVVPGLGIIDVAAAGIWRRPNPRRVVFEREPRVDRFHVVFIECKATRADFLRDQGRQQQFEFALRERSATRRVSRPRRHRHASPALGKFDSCLLRPHANQHYLLAPPGVVRIGDIPRRWGLLVWEQGHVRVLRRPAWQEVAEVAAVEGAIARALTAQRMRRGMRRMTIEPVRQSSPPAEVA
ncbi:MAG: hypothetical protein J5J06_06620 [Phycisphaerae bacterium]|nr:hypothetical protein [Phycisphaerae bacterium]